MKTLRYISLSALLIGSAVCFSACSSNDKRQADSDTVTTVDDMPVAQKDSTALFFEDPSKAADTPSDSTYMTTASGLKYRILKEGNGKSPEATDEVTVNYTGSLTTGYVFDSTDAHGEPATFPLNRVIPGWTEGLQLMKEGGKTMFYIPGNLAYGPQGQPAAGIGPDEPLIFEVELIKVN